jgi:DNA-binding NarL/FixJ family response regulator
MSLDQAIAYARRGDSAEARAAGPGTGRPSPSGGARPRAAGGLTPREREVAVLVARGHTNRQIAARLVVAERTASRHVEHILNKLGVHSRAEVAAWAAQHGLLGPAGA